MCPPFTPPLHYLFPHRLEPQGAEAAALAAARGSTTPRSPAVLVLGSCHDDRLLRREGLILETFTSPYKVRGARTASGIWCTVMATTYNEVYNAYQDACYTPWHYACTRS